MNWTIIFFHLLLSAVSFASSKDEETFKDGDDSYIMALNLWGSDEHVSPMRNLDVLSTSDLNTMHTPLETKIAKIRLLREDVEYDNFRKPDINKENHANLKLKTHKREDSKSEPKSLHSSTIEDALSKNSKEQSQSDEINKSSSKVEEVESKDGKKENQSLEKRKPSSKEEDFKPKHGKEESQSVENKGPSSKVEDFESKHDKKESQSVKKIDPSKIENFESKHSKEEGQSVEKIEHSTIVADFESKRGKEENQSKDKSESSVKLEDTSKESKEKNNSEEKSVISSKIGKVENNDSKENRKMAEDSDKFNDFETHTTKATFKSEDTNNLEHRNNYSSETIAQNGDTNGKGFPINYESSTAWNLLDDMSPVSRRMSYTTPDKFHTEYKGVENHHFQGSDEIKRTFEGNATPRNYNQYVPSVTPVTIPQLRAPYPHLPLFPVQHLIEKIPIQLPLLPGRGLVDKFPIQLPFPINTRRSNQESNNFEDRYYQQESDRGSDSYNFMVNQNPYDAPYQPNLMEDMDSVSREEYNAYPYTPAASVTLPPEPSNPLLAKLLEASEHPQRFIPNFNIDNVHNIPNIPYDNNNWWNNYYAIPIYKYVSGYWR